jgi:hypothetical protein
VKESEKCSQTHLICPDSRPNQEWSIPLLIGDEQILVMNMQGVTRLLFIIEQRGFLHGGAPLAQKARIVYVGFLFPLKRRF